MKEINCICGFKLVLSCKICDFDEIWICEKCKAEYIYNSKDDCLYSRDKFNYC